MMNERARVVKFTIGRIALIGLVLFLGASAQAQQPEKPPQPIPSSAEVDDLLRREPLTLETWPTWRQRLLDWIDDKSNHTDKAYEAADTFVASKADAAGELSPPLNDDYFAWYLFGRHTLHAGSLEAVKAAAPGAEKHLRRSIALTPTFSRAHRSLASVLLIQAPLAGPSPLKEEAEREMQLARELEPNLKMKSVLAFVSMLHGDHSRAEQLYQEAVNEDPESVDNATALAASIVQNQQHVGPRAPQIAPLVARHRDNGMLACFHGLALAMDDDPRACLKEFERARSLGVDPEEVFKPELIRAIETAARPGILQILMWSGIAFVAFYACVMLAMVVAGFLLAQWTRGAEALRLIGDQPMDIIQGGQVERTREEPWLARFYAVSLIAGLILFYVSLPFVTVGLLACTLGALYLIILAGRIPVKLFVLILVVGLAMTWAVLKSMFARMGTGSFGLKKTEHDAPRLFAALREVAGRVDTSPVDEVYISPGSEIGVHQEGRGPWGIFGTKRRVLTLGLSPLRTLTVSELKSILAHEYAHFSHRDTFYSRFIHRVDLSINSALSGMGSAGGKLNYVNPFFWFLVLYYRAYSMLSAGFSRSREFLADRMSCSLYGSNVFSSALTKVVTDGKLFEMTMYGSVASLLAENQAFENMYQAFADYKQGTDSREQRDQIQKELEAERPSLFASHPSHAERLAAAAAFPAGRDLDNTPAIQLFEDPEALEKELTEFLTGAIHFARQQEQAAAQEG